MSAATLPPPPAATPLVAPTPIPATAPVAVPAPVPDPILVPPAGPVTYRADASVYRFTVAQYQRMVEVGVLTDADPVELLDGYVVLKMPKNPPHDGTILRIGKRLGRRLPPGWDIRTQSAVALPDSQPEPDLAVVREEPDDYITRHPTPADIVILIEVANSSLPRDRLDKAPMYAAAGVPVYWIINLVDRRIEVYSQPAGGTYTALVTYQPGQDVPLVLDGTAAAVPAADLLP